MLKKFFQALLSFCMVGIITVSVSLPSSAYSLKTYRLEDRKLRCYYDNWVDSKTKTAVTNAIIEWKKAISSVSFVTNGGILVNFYDVNYPDVAWDGMFNVTLDNAKYVTTATIRFNSAARTWNDPPALQSVAVHEIGHVMGLDDLDAYSKAIMNGYTYRSGSRYEEYGLTEPYWDDINGIMALYMD